MCNLGEEGGEGRLTLENISIHITN